MTSCGLGTERRSLQIFQNSLFPKVQFSGTKEFCRSCRMIDEELREELASIRNMLNEVLVNQDILSKKISADVAIKATQSERAVELARLRKMADKAMKVSA